MAKRRGPAIRKGRPLRPAIPPPKVRTVTTQRLAYACIPVSLLFGSCDDRGDQTGLLPPDLDPIVQLVYSPYKFPEGFYHEELGNGSPYYENTISTTPLDSRGEVWVELSTEDPAQARAWSDSSDAYSSEHRTVRAQRVTERFFEFSRVNPLNTRYTLLSRVHRSSYLAWCKLPPYPDGSVIGVFSKRPVTDGDVHSLAEYLWFIRNYNMGGAKVLSSTTGSTPQAITETILETGVSYGDWGMRDHITVFATTYSVDRITGEIRVERKILRTLEGRQN